jgi:hypothetical protein
LSLLMRSYGVQVVLLVIAAAAAAAAVGAKHLAGMCFDATFTLPQHVAVVACVMLCSPGAAFPAHAVVLPGSAAASARLAAAAPWPAHLRSIPRWAASLVPMQCVHAFEHYSTDVKNVQQLECGMYTRARPRILSKCAKQSTHPVSMLLQHSPLPASSCRDALSPYLVRWCRCCRSAVGGAAAACVC